MWTFSLVGRMCEATGETTFNGLGKATRGPGFATAMEFLAAFMTEDPMQR